jgi:hypothetical protein
MPGNPRNALLVAVETLWTPLMHERSASDCLKPMQGTSQATLHCKLVGEQVKLVIVDWEVFHIALLITELAHRLPKLGLAKNGEDVALATNLGRLPGLLGGGRTLL